MFNLLTYVHLRNIHNSTGAGRVARQVTEHLAIHADVRMHILADAGDHRKVIAKVGRPWTEFQYHFFKSDTSAQQARWALMGVPRAEHYWPDADIVYCTGESYVPVRKQRLVVTLHDAAIFETGAHPPGYRLFKQRLKWQLLYRILSKRADLFHTVSYFSAERLGRFFPAIRSRLRVIYNAASERFSAPVSSSGEQFLEVAGLRDTPYILVPGGLHYRKNAQLILDGWPLIRESLRGYRLVVAGHCSDEYICRARALGRDLLLTGFVDDDVLCSLYHGARAVWFPSKYEGFGVPVVESMACGAPVVASKCTAIPEVAGDAAILAPPEEVSGHVEALEALCNNNGLRQEMIARGRRRAKEFTWQAAATKLVYHLQSVL
ncbi:MAG: glycosyltransferase family 4 protein [Bryobacteraceae bacterium]